MAIRIEADIVIASAEQVHAPGQIVIEHGRILEVVAGARERADIQLEGIALLPGLINPHTHLEFSDLDEPLPPGENFPEWIASVLAFRQNRAGVGLSKLDAIKRGWNESACHGVVALSDIVTPPWQPDEMTSLQHEMGSSFPVTIPIKLSEEQSVLLEEHLTPRVYLPRVIACIEQLGLSPERMDRARQWSDEVLAQDSLRWGKCLLQLGLSPHAPYSTPPELWRGAINNAQQSDLLVAMHLAESPAERQWLDEGRGPMAEMLEHFGIESTPQPKLISSIVEAMSTAPRGLIIHGNYLSVAEMDMLSRYRKRLRVVYCPRTHKHFGHAAYPLQQLLQGGISVLLGTDSRSTNPDLNLWLEARCALASHSCLSPRHALASITSLSANALGIAPDFGSLCGGALAHINVTCAPETWSSIDELVSQLFFERDLVTPLSNTLHVK